MRFSRLLFVAVATSVPLIAVAQEPASIVIESIAVPLPVVFDESVPAAPREAALQLDLWQAIETSLAQNPDLTALRRNEGVSLAALGVARTYPFNPFIQVQATPYQDARQAGPGTVYHYVLLMQQIQLGRQPRFRAQNAAAALQSVRWNIVQAELQNTAQTERLYFTTLYLRGLRDLATAAVMLNDRLLDVSEKRLAAGDTSAADTTIVRLDHRSARQQARLAEANYQTALLDLRRHLNLPIHAPLELGGDLLGCRWQQASTFMLNGAPCPPSGSTEPLDDVMLAGELAASRPDVLAARADVAAAAANVEVARGSRIPDLQVGPYYQRNDSGVTFVGFRAQTDIPVLNNGLPLMRQREAETRQRSAVWQQMQTRAHLEVEAALARYRRAVEMIADFEPIGTDTLPDELARLENQFTAGEVDVLRVTTARTSLLLLRRAELDAANEAAQAAAALTAASGLPLESLLLETASRR